MDVSAFVTLVGVVMAFGAAVWTTILTVPEDIRGACSRKQLWHNNSFPKTIRDIEEEPNWRAPVRIYYVESESHSASIFFWLILGLLFVVGTFAVCVTADNLKKVILDHGFSALAVAQSIVLTFSLVWVAGICVVNIRAKRRLAQIAVGNYTR